MRPTDAHCDGAKTGTAEAELCSSCARCQAVGYEPVHFVAPAVYMRTDRYGKEPYCINYRAAERAD